MADAVTLARLHGVERVDWALGHAATFGRFAEGDLASILAAHPAGEHRAADDGHSLQAGTRAWDGFGAPHDRRHRRTRRRGRRAAAPAAPAAHAPPRPRRAGHRQGATLGTRRSRPGAARRRARRPPSLLDQHPPRGGRVPHRQDLRHLGRDRVSSIPAPTQRSLAHPRVDRPPREPRRLRTVRHRQEPPPRSPRPRRHRPRLPRPLVLPRSPRRARAPPPRRRHHQPSDPQD